MSMVNKREATNLQPRDLWFNPRRCKIQNSGTLFWAEEENTGVIAIREGLAISR